MDKNNSPFQSFALLAYSCDEENDSGPRCCMSSLGWRFCPILFATVLRNAFAEYAVLSSKTKAGTQQRSSAFLAWLTVVLEEVCRSLYLLLKISTFSSRTMSVPFVDCFFFALLVAKTCSLCIPALDPCKHSNTRAVSFYSDGYTGENPIPCAVVALDFYRHPCSGIFSA